MPESSLEQAQSLYQAGNFSAVIKALEPSVYQYRNSYQFYYLLGMSCLYLKDYNGADSYLNRASQLDPEKTAVLLGLAVIALRKYNNQEAINIWLGILETDPRNKAAHRGLSLVRQGYDSDVILENKKLYQRILPPLKQKNLKLVITVFFILILIAFGGYWAYRKLADSGESRYNQAKGSSVAADTDDYTQVLNLSATEIDASVVKAKKYFNTYHDNLAQVEINRVLLSASTLVQKETVLVMQNYLKTPDFSNFRDNFAYAAVKVNPQLFAGVYVRWKGKIANLQLTEAVFDFLVGYQDEKELQGIVLAKLAFAADIKNGDNLDVIARVQVNQDSSWEIVITSIHPLL